MAIKQPFGPRDETYDAPQGRGALKMPIMARKKAQAGNSWITDPEPHKVAVQTAEAIIRAQGGRLKDNTRWMSLYANQDFMSPYSQVAGRGTGHMPRMSDNQLRIHTDTLVGKLVQGNSRVTMLTSGGNWQEWNKARKIENAVEGEFARMKLYSKAQIVGTHGIVTGTGCLKVNIAPDGKSIECAPVFTNNLFVDNMEVAYGAPTKYVELRYVMQDTLIAQFPDKADAIMRAKCKNPPSFAWTPYSPGMIPVYEWWAVPIGHEGTDGYRVGRHIICIDGATLNDPDEWEWTDPYPPLIFFKPGDGPMGFYGQGFVEQTAPTQIALNKTINVMERAAHLGLAPHWYLPEGSGIQGRHLDNVPGSIIEYSGAEPKWVVTPPFHAAAPAYVQMLRSMISDYFGANGLETGGALPVDRLDSRKALREYQDMTATRITTVIERWQDFYIEVAERVIMLARKIAEAQGGYPVLVKKTYKEAIQLDWRDLDISKDAYMLRPAPANMLSGTPSGKLQDIQELMQSGLISQKQGQRMLQGPPDIQAAIGEATATEDDIDRLIEQFVEGDFDATDPLKQAYRPPNSYQDLPRGIKRVADAFLQYSGLGLSEERLTLFTQWLEEANDKLSELQQQSAAPQGGAPPLPPDMTGAPPNGAAAPGPPAPTLPPPGGAAPSGPQGPPPGV